MKHWNAVYAFSLAALCISPVADAEVFKCIGAGGKIIYSEKKEEGARCTAVTTPINVMPATRAAAPAPKFKEASNERDGTSELGKQITEQARALDEAKKALAEQENIRLGGEHNYQRVLDRLKPYQDKVTDIEKKLTQLREEQGRAK